MNIVLFTSRMYNVHMACSVYTFKMQKKYTKKYKKTLDFL